MKKLSLYHASFQTNKFFQNLIKDGYYEAVDQWSREMTLEVTEIDNNIITFGDFGDKFYVVISGAVGIYIPRQDTFEFTYKEFLEFVLQRKRFIKTINGEHDLKLPYWIDICQITNQGEIDMEDLDDYFAKSYRNTNNYNRNHVIGKLVSK